MLQLAEDLFLLLPIATVAADFAMRNDRFLLRCSQLVSLLHPVLHLLLDHLHLLTDHQSQFITMAAITTKHAIMVLVLED